MNVENFKVLKTEVRNGIIEPLERIPRCSVISDKVLDNRSSPQVEETDPKYQELKVANL